MLIEKLADAFHRLVQRRRFRKLRHVTHPLPGGGMVLVLNTGALIGAEAEAMLQALHSRSIGGVLENLEVLIQKGAEEFMKRYFVGYGHKSIGDCGSCTIFIEGVSMLAEKAVQDWPLYDGQASSTRFVDFGSQPFVNTLGLVGAQAHKDLRQFYLYGINELPHHLVREFPRKKGEKESVHEKAILARAFDIMRGFLPAGAETNFSWHSTLRQAVDKLLMLRHHPLQEVRVLARIIEDAMCEAFASSFTRKRYEATEKYNADFMANDYYFVAPAYYPDFVWDFTRLDYGLIREYRRALESRPPNTELPKQLAECGTATFKFLLDFGSFRDSSRHRAVHQRMPLLTFDHGFHPWYLEQLPENLRILGERLLKSHQQVISEASDSKFERQYAIPMGFLLPNRLSGNLPALVYLAELRSKVSTHWTLRARAQEIGKALRTHLADFGLVIHLDDTPDRFDIRRGEHDIVVVS